MIVRNAATLQPALHRGMVAMAQLASDRADSAFGSDDFGICGHGANVRSLRTTVNVESVPVWRNDADMDNETTLGQRLRELQERSGLSYDAIARKAGYTGRSSVQRYFSPDYNDEYLPLKVASKLAKGFQGTSVADHEIFGLAGLPETNATVIKYEGASNVLLRRDIPVYGTSLGAPLDFDGEAIEQTMLNTGNIIAYLPRPSVLNGQQHAYGLYVQGVSMAPRFEDGETLFVTDSRRAKPPKIGDDVVVYMRDLAVDDGETCAAVLVKRLVRRTASYIELEQFNPARTFRLEVANVLRIDRVIPWSELLS